MDLKRIKRNLKDIRVVLRNIKTEENEEVVDYSIDLLQWIINDIESDIEELEDDRI